MGKRAGALVRCAACVALLFLALPAPPRAQTANPQQWTGQVQCQLTVQMQGYAHQETQTWKLTGDPPTMNGAMPLYPATWSVTGEGSTQRSTGAQMVSGAWKSSVAPMKTAFAIFERASDHKLVFLRHTAQLTAPAAVLGTRQSAGAAATRLQMSESEWTLPVIVDVATSTNVSGTATISVYSSQIPMRPTQGNDPATCTWQFSAAPSTGGPGVTTGNTPATVPNQAAAPQADGGRSPVPPGGAVRPPASTSPGTTGGTASGGTASGGSSTAASTTVPGMTMTPPTAKAGADSVTLSWTAPANTGGGAVDSYIVEVSSGTWTPTGPGKTQPGPTTLHVKAPTTTATASGLFVCQYPMISCVKPNTYKFRVRAHTAAGYGPYSDYTVEVRPLISYSNDNVAGVWKNAFCTHCHKSGSRLPLDADPQAVYNTITTQPNVISTAKPLKSLLLTCPTGKANTVPCSRTGAAHPPGMLIMTSSMEYAAIRQWILDGHPF